MAIGNNQITAMIGPSGCGKSTLLRALNRMNDLIPGARVRGRVAFHGTDLYAPDVDPIQVRRRIGLGAGLFFPALTILAMSGVKPHESGLASGLVNTSLQVGGAIGLAVLATLASERSDSALAQGESAASALNSGYNLAYLIGIGLVAVAIAVAVSVLEPEPQPAMEPEAEHEQELARRELAYNEAG